jgi:hypothetical protein
MNMGGYNCKLRLPWFRGIILLNIWLQASRLAVIWIGAVAACVSAQRTMLEISSPPSIMVTIRHDLGH